MGGFPGAPFFVEADKLIERPDTPLRRRIDGNALLMQQPGLLPLHICPAAEDDEFTFPGDDVGSAMDRITEDDHTGVVIRFGLLNHFRIETGIGNSVAGEVDGIADPAVAWQEGPQVVLEGLCWRGDLEAQLLCLVNGEDGCAARAGNVEKTLSGGLFHVGQGFGKIVELFQIVGPVDFVFPENGFIDGIIAGQRFGMALRRHPASGGPPGLQDDDGF